MTDYKKMYDILEMAEVLTNLFENELEVKAVNRKTDQVSTVIFQFNEDGELVDICTE